LELLTKRELEILGYLARGWSKKEIASTTGTSVKTVEQHCSNIMDKLDIHDRVKLARYAIREGVSLV
jgi:DNA-binding NarL/FixJ family response regulator